MHPVEMLDTFNHQEAMSLVVAEQLRLIVVQLVLVLFLSVLFHELLLGHSSLHCIAEKLVWFLGWARAQFIIVLAGVAGAIIDHIEQEVHALLAISEATAETHIHAPSLELLLHHHVV